MKSIYFLNNTVYEIDNDALKGKVVRMRIMLLQSFVRRIDKVVCQNQESRRLKMNQYNHLMNWYVQKIPWN